VVEPCIVIVVHALLSAAFAESITRDCGSFAT
jgi:hypothetical protein